MEIHTNRARSEQDLVGAPSPDQSRYLRRKATQKLRKSHFASRWVLRTGRIAVRVAASLLGIALVLSIFLFAYNSSSFALRNVTVHGCGHLDPRQLEAEIRAHCPSNLLRLDLDQLRILVENQTWVKRAEIRRVLPSDLVVCVTERVPVVVLEMRGDLMLTDDDGVLLGRYDSRREKLDVPVFKGALGDTPKEYRLYQRENGERIRLGLKMLSDLEAGSPDYPKYISEVDLSDKTNLKVTLVNETAEVFLGDQDFLKRFRALMSNLNQYQELKLQYDEIAVVDLRFDGNIIYRPRRAAGGKPVPVAGGKRPSEGYN